MVHSKHKFYRRQQKSDYHQLTASSAQLVLSYIDQLAENKSRIDEDWKVHPLIMHYEAIHLKKDSLSGNNGEYLEQQMSSWDWPIVRHH